MNDALNYLESNNWIGSLGNISAELFFTIPDLNWVGFYLWDGEKLVLGPFHGKPACTIIALGRGVCGQALRDRRTLVVEDVGKHPDHIVCDSASKSEVAIPIFSSSGKVLGLLDVDSPKLNRFDPKLVTALEEIAAKVGSFYENWL